MEANGGGVVVPPPEVKTRIETTARAVSRSKDRNSLVQKILKLQSEVCSFLRNTDQYYPYYKKVLGELDGVKPPEQVPPPPKESETPSKPETVVQKLPVEEVKKEPAPAAGLETVPGLGTTQKAAEISKVKAAEIKLQASRPVPTEPPPAEEFTWQLPLPIPSAKELEVIRLTAQFAACCGRPFLAGVNVREYRNPEFAFLKPEHPHFALFQTCTEMYERTIKPNDSLKKRIEKLSQSKTTIFEDAQYKLDWQDLKDRENSKDADEERLQMQLIDWHDFVLVETIELDEEDDSLPVPIAPEQAMMATPRAKAAPTRQAVAVTEPDDVDMADENDMDIDEEPDQAASNATGDIPANLVRKNYVPNIGSGTRPARDLNVVLPSGQTVPVAEATASMKVELLDPKYKEERMRAAEKNRLQNLASDDEIARNLGRLIDAKTEVFGRADLQEALHTKQIDPPPQIASALTTTPLPAVVDAPKPAAPGQAPAGGTGPPPPVSMPYANAAAVNAPDQPPEKRPRVEAQDGPGEGDGSALVSEEDWVAKQGSTVRVHVKMPTHANKDWDLQGQTITLEVPLTAKLGALKVILAKSTKLPANKQKLQVTKLGFLKDSNSLAHYNISPDTNILLEVKERGGKKK